MLLTEAASKSLTDAVVPVPSAGANQLVENADGSISLVASSGTVEADTIAIDAAEGAAYVAGALDASSADSTGGQISVLGDTVRLDAGAAIDASGATGGGEILIGGDFQGKNGAIRNATRTAVHSEAELTADARITGDGGEVIVWADDFTDYRGTISARATANSPTSIGPARKLLTTRSSDAVVSSESDSVATGPSTDAGSGRTLLAPP